MENRLLAIIVLFIVYVTSINNIKAEADDLVAMLKLASAFYRPPVGWTNKTGSDYCNWDGVKCDESSKRVIEIYLSDRNLIGTLPSELSTLSQLQYFSVARNQLSGPLPSFGNLSFLKELYLNDNLFTSVLPGFLQGLTSLRVLYISQNTKLRSWYLPNDLANTSLVVLKANDANIKGSIPDIFSSLRSLQDLDLSYNFLNGTLPSSFANCTIQNLWLINSDIIDTGLSGTVDVVASMKQLRQANLRNNMFTGAIPDLSNCKNLFFLDLSNNYLTGLVPLSLVSHPTLRNVSLSYNNLQGPIPQFRTNMTVTFSYNNFCVLSKGTLCDPVVTTLLNVAGALQYPLILSERWAGNDACSFLDFINCDSQRRVIILNLASQNFNGTISPDFSNLTDLRNLMLNDNNLTGTIPDGLTRLPNLQMLDISNNNLSGKVPNFSSSVKVYEKGNPFLIMLDNSETRQEKSSEGNNKIFIIVGVAISASISVILFALLIYKCKRRFLKPMKGMEYYSDEDGVLGDIQSRDSSEGKNILISMKFLRQATNNFSEANILGKGGFGVVYKGECNDGTFIAVKRMKATKELKGFHAEIKVLTRLRHRRLVELLGYFMNHNEKILVYEYMSQGTLQQHLFEWREHGFHPLTWKQRVTIALDVARGVEYLHSLAQETFIHRDLKPSNVLLDDDMRAKVADFGLVKRTSDCWHSTETKLAGTFGYLAPEYAATGKVTTKVDVYAFGVILMELITGRKAVDQTLSENGWMCMHLVTWFRSLLTKKEGISSVIDKSLNPDEETQLNITKVAELAEQCTSSEPHQRPDMSHVVNTLGFLVDQWIPPSQEDQVNHLFDGKNFQLDVHFLRDMQVDEYSASHDTVCCRSS